MKRAKTLGIIILCLLMVCLLTVAFVACNDKGQQNNNVDISQDTPPDIEDNTDPNGQGTTPGGSVDTHPSTTHTHTYTLVEENAPTCTEDGNILYYTCTCGKFFNADKQEITQAETIRHSTGHDKVTTNWESDGTSHWHKCNNCNEKLDIETHTESGWIEDASATCKAKAHHHKECTVCHYHTEEEDFGELRPHEFGDWIVDGKCNANNTPVTRHKDCANCDYREIDENYIVPHTWKEQLSEDKKKECSVCGAKENVYEEKNNKIYFGEYPQTKVTDNGITATLAQKSGDRPVSGNSGAWTDYGYYMSKSKSEYMWYIDLEYGGERYRGVYFTSYRPYDTSRSSSKSDTYQDNNGYSINTLYWFKWEPIEWRVLIKVRNEAFLMSNVILDGQQYYYTDDRYGNPPVYANNYKESDIRTWLNGTFYNAAFNELEQAVINTTTVNNSASTTNSRNNSNACENTSDKVFLLSYNDVLNVEYGFNSSYSNYDTARLLKTTEYAQAQGAYTYDSGTSYNNGYGSWWLRSPDYLSTSRASEVSSGSGNVDVSNVRMILGVVPAIKIQL